MLKIISDNKKIKIANFFMELEDSNHMEKAISFLEGLKRELDCNEEGFDPTKSISNIMIYLLSKVSDPKKLEELLMEKENNPKSKIDFDLNFALLLCQHRKLTRCEIILYGMMGLYEEAVELSMNKDQIDLAKFYASRPESDNLKNNLWLKIALHQMKVSNVNV